MKKNVTSFPHRGRLWSAVFTFVLLMISSGPAAAVTDSLLHLETFASGLPGTWSKNSSWVSSANGNGGTGGSMYCDLYDYEYQHGVMTTPSLNASQYSASTDSVWIDFDLCWQYNSYNSEYGNDTLTVTTGTDVLLTGVTANLATYTTNDYTISYDPPTGTAFWRHYHLLVPVTSRTAELSISFIGAPRHGSTNPAIDNVSLTAKAGQMRLTLSRYAISLGNVRLGTIGKDTLTLTSSAPILPVTILSNTMKDGSHFGTWPHSTQRVLANSSHEIDSVFFTPPAAGFFSDSLLIATNSDTAPQQNIAVYVSGQGIQAIFHCISDTTLNFGPVKAGHTTQQTFSFSNMGDDTLFLDPPAISGGGFSIVSGPESLILLPDRTEHVVVEFAPTALQTYEGTLSFHAANGVWAPTVRLMGSGLAPQLSIADPYSIGGIRVGDTLLGMVRFQNTGNDTLFLSDKAITQPSNLFMLAPCTQSQQQYDGVEGTVFTPGPCIDTVLAGVWDTIFLTYAPIERGQDAAELQFITNDPANPEPVVTITGRGLQGVLNPLSGSPYSFGHLRIQNAIEHTYCISNTGDDTLYLYSPTVSGTGFSFATSHPGITSKDIGNSIVGIVIPDSLRAVPPGQTYCVDVQFAPTQKGRYYGTLSFTALNSTGPLSVPLLGLGTAPQIAAQASLDFGIMRVDRMLGGTVSVTNTSLYDTLHIQASITQASDVFQLGTYNEVLLPGESGVANLSYVPNLPQNDTGVLTLLTDDPTQPNVPIMLTGFGALPQMVTADNHDTIDLGQVKVNSSTTHGFAVTNNGTWDLVLSSPTVTGAAFNVTNYAHRVSVGAVRYVSVTFTPTAVGPFSGSLTIAGDDPYNPTDIVYLKGTGITSALAINPVNVDFGTVPVYSVVVDTVQLTNSGAASVNISSYTLSPQAGTFAVLNFGTGTIGPNGTTNIILSFRPDAVGNFSGTLTLGTDEVANPIRTINLYGIGVKGVLALSPSSINFGDVTVGHDSTVRAWLKNTGGAPLTINSMMVVGAEFSHAAFATPNTIAAGDSMYTDLVFAPTVVGEATGSLFVTLSDNTLVALAMQGMGIPSAGVGNATAHTMQSSITVSPNPATSDAVAHITLDEETNGQLELFDVTGHRVLQLVLGPHAQGSFDVNLPTEDFASGTYFVRLTHVNGTGASARLVVTK